MSAHRSGELAPPMRASIVLLFLVVCSSLSFVQVQGNGVKGAGKVAPPRVLGQIRRPHEEATQRASSEQVEPEIKAKAAFSQQEAIKGGANSNSGPSLVKPTTTNESRKVTPSKESDGNSQVVYVNFARVIGDEPSSPNKTDTPTRLVGSDGGKTIKQDAAILCGETNRNGQPSINPDKPQPDVQLPNRIVGGTRAEPGEFPYQVRLNIRSRRGSSLCGGVIIDQRHILTAAHCMTTCSSYFVSTSSIDPSSITATIGDLKITVSDGEQNVAIERVTPHQRYSACSYSHNNYDIAILKTAKPMSWVFTKDGYGSVNRACLPHPNDEYVPGENLTVSGWGVMSEGEGSISNSLNAVDVPVTSYDECRAAYGQRVNRDHVCAGLKQGGKDSCQGDSGGPLVRRVNGQSELAGIVSFGYGCAQAGAPGVYTKVSHYIDWIENNL